MSEVATVEGVEVVKVAKPRKASVSAEKFIAALKAGSLAEPKQTAKQVADALGMAKTSFDQRLNQSRNDWKAMVEAGEVSGPFPFVLADGRSERDGVSVKGQTTKNAILAALTKVDTASPTE